MGALDTKKQERGSDPPHSPIIDAVGPTIADRLEHHAAARPDDRAFAFLDDGNGADTRTWAELAAGARAMAAFLNELPRTDEQPRALLLMPQNAVFLDALFGCLRAGVCAVPTTPRYRRGWLRHCHGCARSSPTPDLMSCSLPANSWRRAS